MKISHWVASFVIFAILTSLFITIYTGVEDGYNVTKSDVMNLSFSNSSYGGERVTEGNIMEQFKEMNLIEGISEITASISNLGAPGNALDILGNLASLGLGVLKITTGVIIAPASIVFIISKFYGGEFPAYILTGFIVILMIYIAYRLLSAYLRFDI